MKNNLKKTSMLLTPRTPYEQTEDEKRQLAESVKEAAAMWERIDSTHVSDEQVYEFIRLNPLTAIEEEALDYHSNLHQDTKTYALLYAVGKRMVKEWAQKNAK